MYIATSQLSVNAPNADADKDTSPPACFPHSSTLQKKKNKTKGADLAPSCVIINSDHRREIGDRSSSGIYIKYTPGEDWAAVCVEGQRVESRIGMTASKTKEKG